MFVGSTTDGKIYHMRICPCGHQDTSGKCEHISEPLVVEQMITDSVPTNELTQWFITNSND